MTCLFLKCASSLTGFLEPDLNGSLLVLGKLSLQCAMSHLTMSNEGWSVLAANSALFFLTVQKAEGTARHCYISDLLEDTQHQDEEGVRDTGANVYSGELD